MTALAITKKGQVTLKRDLLRHLGVRPGERVEFDKLPGGELRVKAARPSGTIDSFIGKLSRGPPERSTASSASFPARRRRP